MINKFDIRMIDPYIFLDSSRVIMYVDGKSAEYNTASIKDESDIPSIWKLEINKGAVCLPIK